MKESNIPIDKLSKMLSLKSTIFLRLPVTALVNVDYIFSTGALG